MSTLSHIMSGLYHGLRAKDVTVSSDNKPTAWVTHIHGSFADGKRLFLTDSVREGFVLVEFLGTDTKLRVGEIRYCDLDAFMSFLGEGEITTAFELCEGQWLINPERETSLTALLAPASAAFASALSQLSFM